jgi:hypothetical protein
MKRRFCLAIVLFSVLSTSSCTATRTPAKTELLSPPRTSAAASAMITPKSTPAYTIVTSSPINIETSYPAIEETKPGLDIGEYLIEKDGYIYYQDGRIYKRNIKNNHKEVIWDSDYFATVQQMFFGYDDAFYYLICRYVSEEDASFIYELYRYNPNGDDDLLIREKDIYVLEINDKYIYLRKTLHDIEGIKFRDELLRYEISSGDLEPVFMIDDHAIMDYRDGIIDCYETSPFQEYFIDINTQEKKEIPFGICRYDSDNGLYYGLFMNSSGTTFFIFDRYLKSIEAHEIQGVIKNFSDYYLYGDCLYIIDGGDYANQNSTICKFNILDGQCIKRTEVKGIVGASASDGKNIYLYTDNENENYIKLNKKLLSYGISKGNIKQIGQFDEQWGYWNDLSVFYMDIAGGYIWGYCADENEMFQYLFAFSVPVPK